MNGIGRIVTLVFASALAACSLPTTAVKSGADRPTLAVVGAPVGSLLLVDGVVIGDAATYDGVDKVLTVEPGVHIVTIKNGGNTLYSQKVFSSNGELARVTMATEPGK